MQDFPPTLTAYTAETIRDPDTRSPGRFLWWLIREHAGLYAVITLLSLAWLLPAALTPWIFGRAIDAGILAGDAGQVVFWSGLLLVITVFAALSGALYHTMVVRAWLVVTYATIGMVGNKSTQLGHVITRRSPTGEVLSVAGGDAGEFSSFLEITSRTLGNVIGYGVVAGIVLTINPTLGWVVLLVAPLLVIISSLLLGPVSRAQRQERSRDSELTSQATDIVAGLRILRGIGGERIFGNNYARQSQRVRQSGVRAGAWVGLVDSVGVLLAGLFVVVLTWLGVREVAAGDLNLGELVTFLGYALFLLGPIRTFFECATKVTRAIVSARKTIALFDQPSPWPQERTGALPTSGGDLLDERSGLRVPHGSLTMVVAAAPEESAALADRLGRYLPSSQEAPPKAVDDELKGRKAREAWRVANWRRAERIATDSRAAQGHWGVQLGGVDLGTVPIESVREQILVSDTAAQVFAGTLQRTLDPHGRLSREQAEVAMYTAAAEDVYEAVPGGWQGRLDERGRGLSGGQRQRLVLARALATDPTVLVLVEPTSAVDAHTEAMIADRLPGYRAGRTTVVMTASPLLLHHADQVVLLEDGVVVAAGTHQSLADSVQAYRRVVLRGEGDEATGTPQRATEGATEDVHPATLSGAERSEQ